MSQVLAGKFIAQLMMNDLSDLEHVRQRPTMYIGDTGSRGLHQCVYELIDFASIRDATRVLVSLNANGGVTVTDDGLGFQPGTLERCMTDLRYAKLQNKNINVVARFNKNEIGE